MTKEEKFEELVNYVETLGLKYTRPKFPEMHTCHLFVLPYKIAVHIANEQDDEFRKKYKKRLFITDECTMEDLKSFVDRFIEYSKYTYEHREEIAEKKRKNMQYHKECWQRHLDRLARREAHFKRLEERKAEKESEKPKRKRQRIVRYEKV